MDALREIQLKDAKARLSAVVNDALRGEEFVITRHGHREAVVVSWETWRRLSNVPSFGRLLAAVPLHDADLGERNRTPLRDADL
jgi:prevent-host-death family protein